MLAAQGGEGEGGTAIYRYIGMCRCVADCCEGYGFQAVYSGIEYIRIRELGSRIGYHFSGN